MGRRMTSLAVAWAAAVILTGPAAAQWRYYDGYHAYPLETPSYPPFPGDDRSYEPRPQPPGSYGYGAPDSTPYGMPMAVASLKAMADPIPAPRPQAMRRRSRSFPARLFRAEPQMTRKPRVRQRQRKSWRIRPANRRARLSSIPERDI